MLSDRGPSPGTSVGAWPASSSLVAVILTTQASFLNTCNGGVFITSRELNHPINIVRKTTPNPIVSNSIQSKANVISKKNFASKNPLPSESKIPVNAENKPNQAYSINVILMI